MGKGSEITLTNPLFLSILGTMMKKIDSGISLLVTGCVHLEVT